MNDLFKDEYIRETHRKRDSLVEQEISKFLDKTFYKSTIIKNPERKNDTKTQYDGIDIIVTIPSIANSTLFLDEKSQSSNSYIGSPKKTFAFELSSIQKNGKEKKGWLIDTAMKTQYYLLIWIPNVEYLPNLRQEKLQSGVDEKDISELYAEEIMELEYCLVEKNQIQLFLESEDYSIENLEAKAKCIRNEVGHLKKQIRISENKTFWFFYTGNLPEKPINVVIRKSFILGLCDIYGTITRNESKQTFRVTKNYNYENITNRQLCLTTSDTPSAENS